MNILLSLPAMLPVIILLLKFLHETESVGLHNIKYFTAKFGQSHSASDYVKFKKKHFRLMMF